MSFDILCDFDGTVSTVDVTDFLLERFAAPGWRELEARWEAGDIGSRDCMARQVALLDCSLAEMADALSDVPIDPGFPAFLDAARGFGAQGTIVSDGIDRAIGAVLARHGIRNVAIVANRLVAEGERSYRLEHPHARATCSAASGTCKCAVAAASAPSRRTILVGDGRSDFCASAAVDLVFAKGALADHCETRMRSHLRFESFAELLLLLPEALERIGGSKIRRTREAA